MEKRKGKENENEREIKEEQREIARWGDRERER